MWKYYTNFKKSLFIKDGYNGHFCFPRIFPYKIEACRPSNFIFPVFLFPAPACTWLRKYQKDYMLEGKDIREFKKIYNRNLKKFQSLLNIFTSGSSPWWTKQLSFLLICILCLSTFFLFIHKENIFVIIQIQT